MTEKSATNKEPLKKAQKKWWQYRRSKIVGSVLLIGFVAGMLIWLYMFRPYVSTNDARIATTLVRIAPTGVSGRIEKVNVIEGDRVKRGQILIELDHRIAQAQLDKAKAKYNLLSIDLERTQKLVKSNNLPQRDLENARSNFLIAEAEVNLAQIALDNTFLKSPIDGIVVQKIAEVGNILDPSQVGLIISDIDHAWVYANIEETFVGRLRLGQTVAIKIDEGGRLTGKVIQILAATASQFSLIPADNAAGNYTKVVQRIPIKIELDPHPNKMLRSGQSVEIRIKVR
ncbi:MAG: HlyD family secretion protein [Candidatus Margulisbacteria bacterium]|nr:HlyD family secretion protein [Candidatus Margulisiibacteriota bacterium]